MGLPTGVSLGTPTATVTITDDDTLSTAVTLLLQPSSVGEGAGPTEVEVTAALNEAARPEATVVTVAVGRKTAHADDYTPVTPFALTIAAGDVRGKQRFTLRPTDDNVAEGSETLEVTGTTTVSGLTVTAADLNDHRQRHGGDVGVAGAESGDGVGGG